MARSGKQVRLAERRAAAGGRAMAVSPKRKWPLRRIVKQVYVDVVPGYRARRDLLECGHMVPAATDMIGDRYPVRRRCGKCHAEALQG